MEDYSNYGLIFVNPIGKNSDEKYEYEFFFSNSPETAWAEDWNISAPSACSNMTPDESMYQRVERLITDIPLFCAQENSCFSYQDCMDNIIALAFEDISTYEEYPTPYRIVFKYGETYNDVIDKLNSRKLEFEI